MQGADLRAAEGRRAGDRRHRARQHAADGLHGGRAEAAEHAGAADRDRDRERAAVRADGAGRRASASGCWRCTRQTEVARAKLESELDARRADPGRPVSRRSCRRSPATSWPRATARRGGAAATTTTRCRWSAPTATQRVLLCVADVSGKGLPASLVMSNMQATLRALLGRVRVAARAGRRAPATCSTRPTAPEKYVTAALAELTPATGAVTLRRRRPPRQRDRAGRRRASCSLASTGAPLGLLPPGLPYERDQLTMLRPGDTLVLFSDGVTDAQNAAGEEFGEARLHRLCCGRSAGQPRERRRSTACSRRSTPSSADAPQFDDMTILVARRLPL